MELVDEALARSDKKMATWKLLHEAYNSGQIAPELRSLKGRRSERALRAWHKEWRETKDMYTSVHGNSSAKRGRKVTQFEQDFLLAILLHENKVSIGGAITHLKDEARIKGLDSPSSESTLRRWVNDWKDANGAAWGLARRGEKFVKEHFIKSIQRDDSTLEVGDVLVADGHVISSDIISPETGKPCRMTLIMFYDWASRYPVGASLALTESRIHILTALRAAILQLGFTPRYIYFDNGKAFKSKLFHNPEDHDLSKELVGILPRLGIASTFAKAYNARTKIIERFFKTMQDQWERFVSSFRGGSIADKPASLQRNERWMQKLYQGKSLEYQEAMDMIHQWVRHYYGGRVHSSLKGKTPWEVFSAREIPADRLINERELDFLMLAAERKHVRNEGIWLNKMRYYDEALIDWVGRPVIIRYDYADARSILVYDTESRYICQALQRESQHAFAHLSDDPVDMEKVIKENREIQRTLARIKRDTKKLVTRSKKSVDAAIAQMGKPGKQNPRTENPLFRKDVVITPPTPKYDVHKDIERMEGLVAQAKAEDEIAASKGADTDEGVAAAVGFDELLELTGIHGGKRR
jgi:putative transposase